MEQIVGDLMCESQTLVGDRVVAVNQDDGHTHVCDEESSESSIRFGLERINAEPCKYGGQRSGGQVGYSVDCQRQR